MYLRHHNRWLSSSRIPWINLIVVLVMAFAANVSGQTPGRPDERPPNVDSARVPSVPDMKAPSMPNTLRHGELPPSSVVEIKTSIKDLKVNVDLLDEVRDELVASAASPAALKYEAIITGAADIRRLANRLLRSLSLPRSDKQGGAANAGATMSPDQLKSSVAALDRAVSVFISSPFMKLPRTVDAELIAEASANLEAILERSLSLQQQAENLAIASGRPTNGKPLATPAHLKSKLKPTTAIQLTLECKAWTIDDLLGRPSEIKTRGSVKLDGIQARTQRHQLAQQLVIPIEDCVDAVADENATSDGLQYVAIVNDFTSFEVKGKVFAYQVTYQVGLTRDNQITKRFNQPVWFYYVDETSDGTFDLFKGSVTYGFMPDWARELGKKH